VSLSERDALRDETYDPSHHFVVAGALDPARLEEVLLKETDRMVGGLAASLIDDTALPKTGKHAVGVAPQYPTTLGKTANCQTLVSITLARDEGPVMVGLRPPASRQVILDRIVKPQKRRCRHCRASQA